MMRRYNAPVTHLPSDLLFVLSLQNLRGSNQPDPTCALLPLGSSHGCKATHEALPLPIPDLGLEGGHTCPLSYVRPSSSPTNPLV